jgi:hypothetical protein
MLFAAYSPLSSGVDEAEIYAAGVSAAESVGNPMNGFGGGGGAGGSAGAVTGGFGDDWMQQASALLNNPDAPFGGQLYSTSFGTVNYNRFSSDEEAFDYGATALYSSGAWGTGQAAANGFNAAQQAYKALTGVDPGLSVPVVDIGYHSGNTWVTMNMNELMDQLHGNGAMGEEESGLEVAGKITEGIGFSAETANTFKLGARTLGESAEFISKGAAIAGVANTVAEMFHEYHPHQVADLTADLVIYGITEASGPVGWVVGGLWFLGNLAYEHYHGGRSITQDLFDGH